MDVFGRRRHRERGRPKYRHHVEILRTILNHHHANGEGLGERRIDNDLRRWFVLKWHRSRCPTDLTGCLRSGWEATRQAKMIRAITVCK